MAHTLFELPNDGRSVRPVLSLKETVVLARIPEDRVRKDIEKGYLVNRSHGVDATDNGRLVFRWFDAIAVAAIYKNAMMSVEHRKQAWQRFHWSFRTCNEITHMHVKPSNMHTAVNHWAHNQSMRIDIDDYIFIDLLRVIEEMSPRINLYSYGLSRVEEKEGVLGGEAVFLNTRLSVLHVGAIATKGEKHSNIREDYPYLNDRDIDFAKIYYLAHPTLGRPKCSNKEIA